MTLMSLVQTYSHSHTRALAVTVDAAVNSGNSGGPVVDCSTGKLMGIAFQGYAGSSVENQGHMVPSPFIYHFLEGPFCLGQVVCFRLPRQRP